MAATFGAIRVAAILDRSGSKLAQLRAGAAKRWEDVLLAPSRARGTSREPRKCLHIQYMGAAGFEPATSRV
jgi:hypothetical protein